MMFKRLLLRFLIIIIMLNFCNINAFGYENKQQFKILILYDSRNYLSYNDNLVTSLEELLGHFDAKVDSLNVYDYKEASLTPYNYIFVLGVKGEFNSNTLLKDLNNFDKTIVWLGKGINNFLNSSKKYSLKFSDELSEITEVLYSSGNNSNNIDSMNRFILDDKKNFTILQPSSNSKIYSYVYDGKNYFPYIVKENNLWYISSVEDNGILLFIFADVLYDIFNTKPENENSLFIRIEDVHPFRDINKLKEIGNFLYSENIPYMIALIPTYVNPETGHLTPLSEKKDFVETIKYLQNHGASIVLHGYTHQNSTGETSGEGFEFWNDKEDAPLDVDMAKYAYDRVGSGIKECVKNGIYPIAFEAPHYAMDSKGYLEVKKYFSTYVGQIQSGDYKFTTYSPPYTLYNTKYFNKLIPENLGYVDEEDKLSTRKILNNFSQLSIVRGYTGGFFFHPYLDIKYLKELVYAFKSYNVNFLDLKQQENWVKCEDISIITKNGETIVNSQNNSTAADSPKKVGYISNINNFFIFLVFTFCLIFALIFYFSKKKDKNKFLR